MIRCLMDDNTQWLLCVPIQPVELDAMRRHFVVTSRYEWMFWEMGYRRESWPV